jgi:hypothetical protein
MPAILTPEVNVMFKSSISTTDPKTGQPLPVPPELLNGVRRASEILKSELGEVIEKFDIEAEWQFILVPGGEASVEFTLTAREDSAVQTQSWRMPAVTFQSDEAIRRSLDPMLVRLAHMLFGLLRVQHEQFQKQLQQDQESLAAVSEE